MVCQKKGSGQLGVTCIVGWGGAMAVVVSHTSATSCEDLTKCLLTPDNDPQSSSESKPSTCNAMHLLKISKVGTLDSLLQDELRRRPAAL